MSDPALRIAIIDDEPLGRQRIADLAAKEPGVEIVGEAANGSAGLDLIRRTNPDLVFLDVQMPGMSGLDVARALGADNAPAIIFVTAYDRHALEAFDLAAIDYLVKPFDDERFEQAFHRARHLASLEETRRLHQRLLSVLQGDSHGANAEAPNAAAASSAVAGAHLQRIPVDTKGKVKYIPVDDIDYILASGPYAELVVAGRRHLIREAMQTLEERLDPAKFMRVHRSSIVQLDRVDALLHGPGGDYEVQLKDGAKLRVSRSKREELAQRLQTLSNGGG